MDAVTKALFDGRTFARGALIAYHGDGITDVLIRLGSGSFFTHVAVALGPGRGSGNDAVCAWQGSGVIENFAAFQQIPCEARMLPADLIEPIISAMLRQVGKQYDYIVLLAKPLLNIFHRKMGGGPPNSFHCSSLIAFAWPEHDFKKPLRAVSPQDCFNAVR